MIAAVATMPRKDDLGPPEREKPGLHPETGPNQKSADHTTNSPRIYPRRGVRLRHAPQDALSQMKRRRSAASRMQPLSCGHVDPWICDCFDERTVSDNMAEAAVAAIVRLDELGTPGLLDADTCLAMHRVGHRVLAFEVYCQPRSQRGPRRQRPDVPPGHHVPEQPGDGLMIQLTA